LFLFVFDELYAISTLEYFTNPVNMVDPTGMVAAYNKNEGE